MENQPKTTLGNRLSTGAVNAAIGGAVTTAGLFSFNGIRKLLGGKNSLMNKTSWIIAGAGAAIAGVVGFFVANRGNEIAREAAINNSFEAIAQAQSPEEQKQKQQELLTTLGQAIDGKFDASSTKFRDLVDRSKSAPMQER